MNLLRTLNALHYHIPQGTNDMNIPSLFIILSNVTLMIIIVIFVKNETQHIGPCIVHIEVILIFPNTLMTNLQLLDDTCNGHHTHLFLWQLRWPLWRVHLFNVLSVIFQHHFWCYWEGQIRIFFLNYKFWIKSWFFLVDVLAHECSLGRFFIYFFSFLQWSLLGT